jgi:hypothetical protein
MSESKEISKELSASDMVALLEGNSQSVHSTEKALTSVTKVGDYLPYIQLCGSNTKQVKRGEFPMGHFSLVENKKLVDLGNVFTAFLVSWRPKAMQYAPSVVSYFDTESAEFKKIQQEADAPNSNKGFGPEFLIWLPDSKKLATFFLGNKTGRSEAPNLIACIKGARKCRIESVLIEDRRNDRSWHGPKMRPYDLEISSIPDRDELSRQLKKFNNPPVASTEAAEPDSEDSRG